MSAQARFTAWPMIAADAAAVALTPGNVADITMARPSLQAAASTKCLIADKAYNAEGQVKLAEARAEVAASEAKIAAMEAALGEGEPEAAPANPE